MLRRSPILRPLLADSFSDAELLWEQVQSLVIHQRVNVLLSLGVVSVSFFVFSLMMLDLSA